MRLYLIAVLSLLCFTLSGCKDQVLNPSDQQGAYLLSVSGDQITCTEPRSAICTREFKPVCAIRDNLIRCKKAPCPDIEEKSYANACTACADKQVISYRHGNCTEQP